MAQSGGAAAVSTRNPPPCDLGEVVMKIDSNGSVRARNDDECTEAGFDDVHTFYIVCPATAVHATHSFLALLPTPGNRLFASASRDDRISFAQAP